jgi:uncharacterized GH25 family protein
MKNVLACMLFIATLSVALPAHSHEFWMTATQAPGSVNGLVVCTMHFGENYDGTLVGWVKSFVTSLRVYSKGSSEDLRERLSEAALPAIELNFPKTGTHLIALDSAPSLLTLSGDKFHAYLHEEGLDAIIKQREAAGTAATPGRERYRRNVKALAHTGGAPDATFAVRTGQRIEIVPLLNPFSSAPGATLKFLVLFDGKPLADALLKAWHKKDSQLLLIKVRTDADGKADLTLPWAGPWMLSAMHMVAVSDSSETDWDSLWGNLTFELPRKAGKAKIVK